MDPKSLLKHSFKDIAILQFVESTTNFKRNNVKTQEEANKNSIKVIIEFEG